MVDLRAQTFERQAQRLAVEARLAPWCPHKPSEKQLDAILNDSFELFFGGAMGGGKSDWILMDALMWVHVPGYQALIIRRSMTESDRMGAILDRAKTWWIGKPGVEFDFRSSTFTFNGCGRITFGYLAKLGDEANFNGTEMQRVYFDEVVDFEWSQYSYLFQRVARVEVRSVDESVPFAVRSAGMPLGIGEEWVCDRFVDRAAPDAAKPWIPENDNGTVFVPAYAGDNPHLSKHYETKALANLDPFTREARGRGNWKIKPTGIMFNADSFPIVERLPDLWTMSVRFHDFAGTEKTAKNNPDSSASIKMHICGNIFYISDMTEEAISANDAQDRMRNLALADGYQTAVRWEEEKGASGVQFSAAIKRHILPEFNAEGVPVSGDKVTRAKPVSKAAQERRVYLVRGAWNTAFVARMVRFPIGKRDVTDATSGAFAYLEENAIGAPVVHDPGDDHRTITSNVRSIYGLGTRVRAR